MLNTKFQASEQIGFEEGDFLIVLCIFSSPEPKAPGELIV